MPPPIPRCSSWAYSSLISPSHFSLPRYGSRVGLHIDLFEACSAFTRVAACTLALPPIRDTLIEGFSHFVTSMTAPIASGWSVAGWDLHPLESAAFARRTPEAVIRSPRPYCAPGYSGNPAFRRPSINSFTFLGPRAINADIVKAGSISSTRAAASCASASRPRWAKADASHW